MKRKIVLLSALAILMLGCGYTDEEKAEMKAAEVFARNNTENYLEQKYGTDFNYKIRQIHLNKYSDSPVPDFSPPFTGSAAVTVESDYGEFVVFTPAREETTDCYDNLQSAEIQDAINTVFRDAGIEVLDIHSAFGKFKSREDDERHMVQTVYDGDIKAVLENSDVNAHVVSMLGPIGDYDFTDELGENVLVYYVSYNDRESFENVETPYYNFYGTPTFMFIEESALYIREYKSLDEHVVFDVRDYADFKYMISEGTYVNFIPAEVDIASEWNGHGFINASKIWDSYKIETDADFIDLYIPRDAVFQRPAEIVYQYPYNGKTDYTSCVTDDYDEYLHGRIYIRDKEDIIFSVFTDKGE